MKPPIHPLYKDEILTTTKGLPAREFAEFYASRYFEGTPKNTTQQESLRRNNIRRVNAFQAGYLLSKDPSVTQKVNIILDEGHRFLVLYFRGRTQGLCEYSFEVMARIAEEYIRNYSRLFDRMKIVPRYPGEAPDDLHSDVTRILNDISGKDFLEQSNVGGNVVHFTNGTVDDWGNVSLIGSGLSELRKKRFTGHSLPLPLYYQRERQFDRGNPDVVNTGDLVRAVDIFIQSIQKLELEELKRAGISQEEIRPEEIKGSEVFP